MAGDYQNQNPNPCSLAKKGYFGSKFVTVCVSGKKAPFYIVCICIECAHHRQ